MAEQRDHRVTEAPMVFRRDASALRAEEQTTGGPCYRAKVFKSGNSLALRLPARLGLEAGMEMELRTEPDGRYTLNHVDAPRRKIDVGKFAGKAAQKGFTLVPLRLYFKKGKAKVEIAAARGKQKHDKRDSLKKAEAKREMDRATARRRRE